MRPAKRILGMALGREQDNRLSALVENLKLGLCTPFLGAGASAPSIPTASHLAQDWATRVGYPFPDPWNLPRVMQYVATMTYSGDALLLKRLIADQIQDAPTPDFSKPHQVHKVLASCDLPLYVTTNYDDFMLRALAQTADRLPRREISPWYDTNPRNRPPSPLASRRYAPSVGEPLIFHLHGHHSEPRSLVLTEDDNIDYLVREAGDIRGDKVKVLPDYVRGRLRATSLLFLGYSLQDWTFHVLFRHLLAGSPQRRNHVSVQLNPGRASAMVRGYWERYLGSQHIWIFWGTTEDFMKKLVRGLSGGVR